MISLFELTVANYIDAAHFLRGYRVNCANIHGHTWRVEVTLQGRQLDSAGLLVDFNDIKKMIKEITAGFDHNLINAVGPFDNINPTSENLARHIYREMKKAVAPLEGIRVLKVVVAESRDTSAAYHEE